MNTNSAAKNLNVYINDVARYLVLSGGTVTLHGHDLATAEGALLSVGLPDENHPAASAAFPELLAEAVFRASRTASNRPFEHGQKRFEVGSSAEGAFAINLGHSLVSLAFSPVHALQEAIALDRSSHASSC